MTAEAAMARREAELNRYFIASRRSLVEQSDRYKAERDHLIAVLAALGHGGKA